MLGFSLNNLSLFGLVLAIGIVVDDAIVVVENVERHMAMGNAAARRRPQGHDRSHRAGHCHRPGALRRVRADRVHGRHQRPILQAVRTDHRRLDGHLGVQLPDAESRVVRILLQPHGHDEHGKSHQEALPRLSIVLLGGLAAMFFADALFGPQSSDFVVHWTRGNHRRQLGKIVGLRAGLFVAGGLAGWFLAGLVNGGLGAFFRGFNRAFECDHRRLWQHRHAVLRV